MSKIAHSLVVVAAVGAAFSPAMAQQPASYGPELQGFDYPHPVQRFEFSSQKQKLAMAFMDIAPQGTANGQTAVLLHGKNFCGATWDATISVLSRAGYRVIVPDQIGFCSSTKPQGYQFSLAQLAANTQELLASKNVEKAVVIGHSMGGMLAARYAIQYPDAVERLVLVNPIGLEDWQAEGVPYADIDQLYEGELKTSREAIKAYQLKFYYNGIWKPEYDRWVDMAAGLYAGPGREIVAYNQAQTSEMIFTQPVVHEFERIQAPTLVMIGGKDRTAPGANRAPKDVQDRLGNYPELGARTAKAIPNATLIAFDELGHSPQVEAPDRFHEALLKGLRARD
ncbi:alpha/beta fold hydrolase [Terrihabitans sp. B22-R8]|uniref:alpha/beta fold hydrolase n=1 Tax=Terrihabitans sp. B22-R8 TaxID=3425128 RepID=UPI00403C3AA5